MENNSVVAPAGTKCRCIMITNMQQCIQVLILVNGGSTPLDNENAMIYNHTFILSDQFTTYYTME